MRTPAPAPFGSWSSPIGAADVARGRIRLVDVDFGADGVYWIESRPAEEGRYVVVRRGVDGSTVDVTPPGFNVRTRVHEYGGGACLVAGTTLFFSNYEDQRLYRQDGPGDPPRPITPEPAVPAGLRYADARLAFGGRSLVCVRERHEAEGVFNEIVTLPVDGSSEPRVLISGNDFYASPRVSRDGRRLAWTTWNHPLMPWDGSELWLGALGEAMEPGRSEAVPAVKDARRVAGGPSESAYQPHWAAQDALYFLSDASGWLNLHRLDGHDRPAPVLAMDAEFGWPQWAFGSAAYASLPDGRLACTWTVAGRWHLGVLDPESARLERVDVPYTAFGQVRAREMTLAMIAAGPRDPHSVVTLKLGRKPPKAVVLRRALEMKIEPGAISVAEPIEFPTDDGLTAHGLFYPPTNERFAGPADERPPLLVLSHGGPTDSAEAVLDPEVQFWTSRGFAVVDVNYGGSTGYGRAYRERLQGLWGVVDVADCVNAATHLAAAGRVDARRMAIRGGSAGGYTTLCALTFYDVFAAGASYFGVADLATLAGETHKFESRYLDSLIGPYPEDADVYRSRSPANFADRLSCPIILFQGLEDEVVPSAQAEMMVAALRAKGIPHAYLAFEGEQHGFRRATTIQAALEAELSFYAQVFGFTPADPIEPVAISGMDAPTSLTAGGRITPPRHPRRR